MFVSRIAVACVCLSMAVGCSGIGDGSRPESLKILQVPANQTLTIEQILEAPDEAAEAFSCVRSQLRVFAIFTDGRVGDFTNRARWRSNNEDALTVSNGDERIPGLRGRFFGFGSLAPRGDAPTTVRVTAEYLDLQASVRVRVKPSGNFVISPKAIRMAPNSVQNFRVSSMMEGRMREITNGVRFTLDNDDPNLVPNKNREEDTDRYGFIEAGGGFRAFDSDRDFNRTFGTLPNDASDDIDDDDLLTDLDDNGDPAPLLTVRAESLVANCKAPVTATVQVTRIPADGLRLRYPEGFSGKLVQRVFQPLDLIAEFGDFNGDGDTTDEGEFQDMSTQPAATFSTDRDGDGDCDTVDLDPAVTDPDPPYPPAAVGFFGSVLSGNPNLVTALQDAGTTEDPEDDNDEPPRLVCARYGARPDPDDETGDDPPGENGPRPADPGVLSNSIPITAIDSPLFALSLEAFDPCAVADAVRGFCTALDPPLTDPLNPTVQAGRLINFRALGSFQTDAGETLRQAITTSVVWSTSDEDIAVIGPRQGLFAGQLIAIPEAAGPVTVTARFIRGVNDTNTDRPEGDFNDTVSEIPLVVVPAEDD
ncbi:MAG: hypothetical protein ACT4QA_04370 [Panacagrimonas sp.]